MVVHADGSQAEARAVAMGALSFVVVRESHPATA
jgi:hypothetical protein